jgi:hypothetical protein
MFQPTITGNLNHKRSFTPIINRREQLKGISVLIILLIKLSSLQVHAAENEQTDDSAQGLSFGTSLDLYSRYVWRGIALSDGAVVQPSVWCATGPLTFSLWSNFVLTHEPNQGQFNELDYTLQYQRSLGSIDLSTGIYYFQFINQVDVPATLETDLTVTYTFPYIELSLANSVDLLEYRGAYFGQLGLGRSEEIGEAALYQEFLLGWSSAKFNLPNLGVNEGSLLLVQYSVSTEVRFGGCTFESELNLSYLPIKKIQDSVEDPLVTTLGIAISWDNHP